jgi:hypothetical protein
MERAGLRGSVMTRTGPSGRLSPKRTRPTGMQGWSNMEANVLRLMGAGQSAVTKPLGTWRYRRQHHQHQLTLSLCARNEFATRIAPAAARRRPSRRRGLGQAAQAMHHRVARDRALL